MYQVAWIMDCHPKYQAIQVMGFHPRTSQDQLLSGSEQTWCCSHSSEQHRDFMKPFVSMKFLLCSQSSWFIVNKCVWIFPNIWVFKKISENLIWLNYWFFFLISLEAHGQWGDCSLLLCGVMDNCIWSETLLLVRKGLVRRQCISTPSPGFS